MTWTVSIAVIAASLAFAILSGEMARERNRSTRAWVVFAVMTAPLPLAPIALLLIGDRKA